MRVLVVDDEEVVRYALSRYLTAQGHQAVPAADGDEALRFAQAEMFDAVITDMDMPGLRGQELFEQLVTADVRYAERVIFMSGNPESTGSPGFLVRAQRPFLRKPFSLSDLDSMLAPPEPADAGG